MGIWTLILPALFLGSRVRKLTTDSYDPEKAIRHDSPRPSHDGPTELDHDSSDDDQDHNSPDVLAENTPHRTVRRVYHQVTHVPWVAPFHANTSSDDLSSPHKSLFGRVKAYIWPPREQNDIDRFVPNYRWTPIISGIVIPFSILLEIPGLTERWYVRTENNQTVETRPNPVILDVGLAISMTFGVIANVCLILRFLEKRVQTVTLSCIVSLTIHDIINIIAVTTFGVEHRFDDGFTYGDSFWMTLCSTIASTVTNISLIVDLIRTPEFSKRGSGLTRKQRGLMIIVIVLLVYVALGAFINSILLKLSFINGLYFTVVSIETIGFGDIHPETTGARIWTCFYIAFGVVNIGVVIAMCRETILEGLEIGYRRRIRDLRQRRREARRLRHWEARWQRAVQFRLREAGKPIYVHDDEPAPPRTRTRTGGGRLSLSLPFASQVGTAIKRSATMTSLPESVFGARRNQHLNVEGLTMAQLEEAALEAGVPLEMFLEVEREEGEHEDGHEDAGAARVNGLPVRAQSNDGIVTALAQTQAAHAFDGSMSSGWPSYPQTPTHAQVGRMSAMITKFAVAVSVTHAHAPGAPEGPGKNANQGEEAAAEGSGACPDSPDPNADVASAAQSQSMLDVSSSAEDVSSSRPTHAQRHPSLMDIRKHPTAKWLKDFSRGANTRAEWTYEQFRNDMETEEKKAYYVKLTIAWLLFFVFWMVGSGIFSATEKWAYGTAMYFCFIAFTTTGYGDLSPQTPAGRSVFVVWALFGVGTLTILISVVQEAGSSRYKSALHSHVFDKAVKKYRKKELADGRTRPRPIIGKNASGIAEHPSSSNGSGHQHAHNTAHKHSAHDVKSTPERLKESQELSQKALEALPGEIVRMSRTFHEYMQFFVAGGAKGMNVAEGLDPDGNQDGFTIPPDMRDLLDELCEMEGISKRVKGEIVQDDDARKTLFMLSLERSLKRLVTSAEKALSTLADRDALASITTAAGDHPPPRRPTSSSSLSIVDLPDGQDREDDVNQDETGTNVHPRAHSQPVRPRHVKHAHVRRSSAWQSHSRGAGSSRPAPRLPRSPPTDLSSSSSSSFVGS